MPKWLAVVAALALMLETSALAAAEEVLTVLPAKVLLSCPVSTQSLLCENRDANQFIGQVAKDVTFTSSDAKVVKVEGNVAIPTGNGKATITATHAGRTATAEVMVTNFDKPFTWNFRNHVEPVLAKANCNGGGCHGALAGKKGFKLSLAGFDPVADYFAITRQARARRVVLDDPGRSLLLTKPTTAMPHKGGQRFTTDSAEYRILSEWIAAGAPGPADSDPKLTALDILPAASSQRPGQSQQLVVLASYSDGHQEDVTRWAKFTSTGDAVASVDVNGFVKVNGQGEVAVKAWFASWNVVATITVPYEQKTNPVAVAQAGQNSPPSKNFVDEQIAAKLASLNLPPSGPATDGEFLRRAYLDTIGVLPTADEVRAYLADRSPDKRARLAAQLLARPEFVDYWSYKWSDLLLVNSEKLRPTAMWSYYHWIRDNVAADTPWDVLAHKLVTAQGSTLENGAANFFVLHQDPQDLAETVSMAFLGMSINCARCHNHPLEKWTNDQYYSMANLFSRVRSKDGTGDGNKVVFAVPAGELVQPRSGKPQPPQPLDGKSVAMDDPHDRREHLAQWLTSPANPYFSRAIANRVWANFFGVGLVEGVDDLRLTNPPSNAPLMEAAARYLVENKFNLKALMRAILTSDAYARSSQPLKENTPDTRFYSRYYPRRLMAEVLLDALSQVSDAPTEFSSTASRGGAPSFTYPKGWRAIQLPDANVTSYFLQSFGRPERIITCECERSAEPSMVQVLHISNGDTLNKKLAAAGNRIDQHLNAGTANEAIIEDLYLAALSRFPTDAERAKLVEALAAVPAAERRIALEDLYWGVLSSKEFLFNH